jgi:hypothetical protein
MTLATEMRRLRESRAYYAAAGASDLAVTKLREVPGQLSRLQERTDPKDLGGAAVAYITHFGARVVEAFDDLAERGRRVTAGQPGTAATPELDQAAKATARKVTRAATAAKPAGRSAATTGSPTTRKPRSKS